MHWNESDAETPRLIEELKEAARREGLSVPGGYQNLPCDPVMGLKGLKGSINFFTIYKWDLPSPPALIDEVCLSDYYHLYVKYLRGGGMDVATALQIIKSLIREYREVTPDPDPKWPYVCQKGCEDTCYNCVDSSTENHSLSTFHVDITSSFTEQ